MSDKNCCFSWRVSGSPAGSLLLLCLASSVASAQSSSVEIGLGYNSEDSYRSGRYTGITQRGGFVLGGFSLLSQPSATDNTHWSVSAKNLLLETASVAASYGQWGHFSLSINYDQLPHYRFNDARTPFNGSGTQTQTLPQDWVGASSSAGFSTQVPKFKQVNIDTRRDRFTGATEWQLTRAWQVTSEYRHEVKAGTAPLGAIFGSTGGNPRGAILTRPIDYQTDEISLGLNYSKQRTHYNFSYNTMHFSNSVNALRFDNPFNNAQWSSGANFRDGAVGQIASEPDNTSHQFSFAGARSFGKSSSVSASVVSTKLVQDEPFLPYSSVFSATTPLPRQNLNGEVDSLVSNLNFSTRLSARSTLRLRYNSHERDNKTPQEAYQRIPGDATYQSGLLSSQTRINRTYDLQRDKLSADLSFRVSGNTRVLASYEYQETDRSMVDVATTTEDTGFVRLNFSPSTSSSAWLKLTRSQRRASTYDSTVPFIEGHNPDYVATLVGDRLFENDPLLRRFHLSDRDRDEISASLNFFPTDAFSLSLLGLLAEDHYPETKIGLQESRKRSLSADLSYAPATLWQASVYVNYDNYSNRQSGFARSGGGNPTPFYPESVRSPANNWRMDSEDDVYTIGAGIDWELMAGKLELALDANYTDAKTSTEPFSSGISFLPFPDVTTRVSTLSLKSHYALQANRQLSFGYAYERYSSNDWAVDGTDVSSLANILLLGNQSPEYSGHILELSLTIALR